MNDSKLFFRMTHVINVFDIIMQSVNFAEAVNQYQNTIPADEMPSKTTINCIYFLVALNSCCYGLKNLLGTNYEVITKGARCSFNPEFIIDGRCHETRINRTTNHGGIEFFGKPGAVLRNVFVSVCLIVCKYVLLHLVSLTEIPHCYFNGIDKLEFYTFFLTRNL